MCLDVEEIPPLLPSNMPGNAVYNTEADKSSVYLESNSKPSGDPALLHKMIIDGRIAMENLANLSLEDIVNACASCDIQTSGKSKQFLCGKLQALYASILVGNCPCHSFVKLDARHTGGFYHLVCRHVLGMLQIFISP